MAICESNYVCIQINVLNVNIIELMINIETKNRLFKSFAYNIQNNTL